MHLDLLMAPPTWDSHERFFQTRRETNGKLQRKGQDRGLWFRSLVFGTSVLNRKEVITQCLINRSEHNSSQNGAVKVFIYTEQLALLGTSLTTVWKFLEQNTHPHPLCDVSSVAEHHLQPHL